MECQFRLSRVTENNVHIELSITMYEDDHGSEDFAGYFDNK